MKKSWLPGIALFALLPGLAVAQSAFDGTWKIDLNKVQMPKKPHVFLLKDGVYRCQTCVPPITIKADGKDHPVIGHPYYDSMAVKVLNDRSVEETDKKAGKIVATSTFTVAPDGKTASVEFTDRSDSNSAPIEGKATLTRASTGPTGSHAVSGAWRDTSVQSLSDNGLIMSFKVEDDHLAMSTPTGQSYRARMDGAEAPYHGDPGVTSVAVTKTGTHAMTETDKRNGKVISVAQMNVSADGKSMNIVVHDKLRGTTTSFVAEKQ